MNNIDNKKQIVGNINANQNLTGSINNNFLISGNVMPGQKSIDNYEKLKNKPSINDVILIGNKKSKELKLQSEMNVLTNSEIQQIIKW